MKKIIIYAEGRSNVFYLSLKDLVNNIVQCDSMTELHQILASCSLSTLVILINKRDSEAIALKSKFPQFEIFSGHGGEKNFSPQLKVIDIEANHQYIHFTAWSELIDKLHNPGHWLQPGLLTTKEQKDTYHFALHLKLAPIRRLDPQFFFMFWYFARIEVAWMADWLHHSSQIELKILNELPKKGKQRRLTIKCDNIFRGLEVCRVGDGVNFYKSMPAYSLDHKTGQMTQSYNINKGKAQVISATKKMIELDFGQPIEVEDIFQKKVFFKRTSSLDSPLVKFYNHFLKKEFHYHDSNLYDSPMRFWQSDDKSPENRAYQPISEIHLEGATKNILSDAGQVAAIHEMLGPRSISLIQGGPGAGKTFTTAVAVEQVIRAGLNCLVVAHSNKALDVLLREISQRVPEKKIFRLGNNPHTITDEKIRKRHRDMRQNKEKEESQAILELMKENQGVVLGVTANSFILDSSLKELFSRTNVDNDYPVVLDYVFVDEASKINFLELLVIVYRAEKVVLIGDDDQLSKIPIPTAVAEHIMQFAKKKLSNESLSFANFPGRDKNLSFLCSLEDIEKWHKLYYQGDLLSAFKQAGLPSVALQFNRRSLPTINEMINEVFAKKLIPGRFNYSNSGRVTLLSVVGREKISKRSFYNTAEAKLVEEELLKFFKKQQKNGELRLFSVAVICSYKAQMELIKKRIRKFFLFHKLFKGRITPQNINDVLNKLIVTVDAYQGDQNELIIITLTRSNDESRVGFLQDLKRLYVASTRAKDEEIFITNQQTLATSNHDEVQEFARKLVIFCKKHKTYVKK
jgi:hypothetical protein